MHDLWCFILNWEIYMPEKICKRKTGLEVDYNLLSSCTKKSSLNPGMSLEKCIGTVEFVNGKAHANVNWNLLFASVASIS